MTNYERIHSMTDEGLAELFGSRVCIYVIGGETNGECLYPYNCKNCWLNWLAEEVNDEHTD